MTLNRQEKDVSGGTFLTGQDSASETFLENEINEKLEKLHTESTKITTLDDFKKWARHSLRDFLPHEVLCCGFGRLNSGSPSVDGIVSIDYPAEMLDSIQNNAGGIDSPLLKQWLIRRAPFTFSIEDPWPNMPKRWLEEFHRFDLRNAAVHAVSDERISIGTYYSFHRIPENVLPLYEILLNKVAPVIHMALWPLIVSAADKDQIPTILKTLTKRELEIVEWVKIGKTNGEIAEILDLAEITVKHHLINIFGKFGNIGSRVQLARRLVLHESAKSMTNARLTIL